MNELFIKTIVENVAHKVASQVKGKVYYQFDTQDNIWLVSIKTQELGEEYFALYELEKNLMLGTSSTIIANNIVRYYKSRILHKFLK